MSELEVEQERQRVEEERERRSNRVLDTRVRELETKDSIKYETVKALVENQQRFGSALVWIQLSMALLWIVVLAWVYALKKQGWADPTDT